MQPYVDDSDFTLYVGDALEVLRELPDESVDCVVTSPPYWGLRDYGTGEWEGGERPWVECACGAERDGPETDCPNCAGAGGWYGICEHESVAARGGRGGSGSPGKQTEGAFPSEFAASECGKCGARRVDQQLGLEPTPDQYVQRMVEVFREIRRVLAPHGTCWVNLGDSYVSGQGGRQSSVGELPPTSSARKARPTPKPRPDLPNSPAGWAERAVAPRWFPSADTGWKPKDLTGIPWMVAFALRADGWYLRSDIIWAKPNPMPESVTDRPTKAHEYVFLLTKNPRYWFDQEAVRERYTDPREGGDGFRWYSERYTNQTPAQSNHTPTGRGPDGRRKTTVLGQDGSLQHRDGERWPNGGRNIRSVWEIATQPYPEAHFATFPEELARRCILAGCPVRVCQACGKPSERIVNASYDAQGRTTNGPRSLEQRHETAGFAQRLVKSTSTEGWSDCGHHDYRPGRVLDPFLGSGTVALVARNHGRHAIGIELSPEYAELAAKRTRQLSLLA